MNSRMPSLFSREKFLEALKDSLTPRYIDKHPLMEMLYGGELSKKQLQAWIVNRFYMQKNVGMKDAAILSNCPEQEVRRIWISRSLRREGLERSPGDIEGWLTFAEAAGLGRDLVLSAKCLPGVRFAVDGLVNFARRSTWLESVATSLYEVLASTELQRRIEALKTHYSWVRSEGFRFYLSRLSQLEQDASVTLDIVLKYGSTRNSQKAAISAALFMSDVTWSLHDAIYMNYVIRDSPLSVSLR